MHAFKCHQKQAEDQSQRHDQWGASEELHPSSLMTTKYIQQHSQMSWKCFKVADDLNFQYLKQVLQFHLSVSEWNIGDMKAFGTGRI